MTRFFFHVDTETKHFCLLCSTIAENLEFTAMIIEHFFLPKWQFPLKIFGPSNRTGLVTLLKLGQGSGHLLFSHYFFAEPLRSRIAAMLRTSMVGVFSISTLSVKA